MRLASFYLIQLARLSNKSSGIRQKGESQNGCFTFPKNKHFLPPDTHTCLLSMKYPPRIQLVSNYLIVTTTLLYITVNYTYFI